MMMNDTSIKTELGTMYIVVDLEATCWERDPPAPNEIIEIGAVAYEIGRGYLSEFQTFVRPNLQPTLSAFCTQLTAIRQEDVDGAPGFPSAYRSFLAWCEVYRPFILASWGDYDRKQIVQDCQLHGVADMINTHLNLKLAFATIMGCGRCGMKRALRRIGLKLEGTHHRGIDDARNITRILEQMLQRINA